MNKTDREHLSGTVSLLYLVVFVLNNPVRLRRIMAFLDPEKYAQGEAWQLNMAKAAYKAGGFFGCGLGNSVQKQGFLPEAHTDFILPIVGAGAGAQKTG
jgi:cell division protein FtsW